MARVLDNVCKSKVLRLASMNAGTAHNAIPGCCTAVVAVACDCIEAPAPEEFQRDLAVSNPPVHWELTLT